MRRYWSYLKYLIRHKWFVLIAGIGNGASLWRILMHDMSKFLPDEFIPYARYFYNADGSNRASGNASTMYVSAAARREDFDIQNAFDVAWLKHQHRNDHHWQHWILRNDDGTTTVLEIPFQCRAEMISDWEGAGRAIAGTWGTTRAWYEQNCDNIILNVRTRIELQGTIAYMYKRTV